MMDQAALLRRYHNAMGEARTPRESHLVSAAFGYALPDWLQPGDLRLAHELRVVGNGSPAACDEALAQALKEVSHA